MMNFSRKMFLILLTSYCPSCEDESVKEEEAASPKAEEETHNLGVENNKTTKAFDFSKAFANDLLVYIEKEKGVSVVRSVLEGDSKLAQWVLNYFDQESLDEGFEEDVDGFLIVFLARNKSKERSKFLKNFESVDSLEASSIIPVVNKKIFIGIQKWGIENGKLVKAK